ncbi:MAG: hypothetical protein LLG16_09280 [Euryarchaeota archaeon]|nr:hypothetical protein [Euryarchaeota archaeon]
MVLGDDQDLSAANVDHARVHTRSRGDDDLFRRSSKVVVQNSRQGIG